MYIRTVTVINEKTGRRNKRYEHSCDSCQKLMLRGRKFDHCVFCSIDCRAESQRSGVLKAHSEEISLTRYGSKNPWGSRHVIEERKQKFFNQYGVENPSQLETVKEKKRATFVSHYGVENNFCRSSVREHVAESLISKFGGLSPSCDQAVKEKMRSPESREKRFRSWCKNGSIRESKPEKTLVKVLESMYGDVCRHVTVNGWSIDMYVPQLDTYIQLDGVWWHGLDRPMCVIEEQCKLGSRVNQSIMKKFRTDRDVDEYFSAKKMTLFRFTDIEVISHERDGTLASFVRERILPRVLESLTSFPDNSSNKIVIQCDQGVE